MLDRVFGSNWVAVGDAACACDPIAAQGIHKALFDGLASAAAIADHLKGAADAFDAYQASVAGRFREYLRSRDYFYHLERRWRASPFWRNRRAGPLQPRLRPQGVKQERWAATESVDV
jgi:flavin-dependent dehydrogenase